LLLGLFSFWIEEEKKNVKCRKEGPLTMAKIDFSRQNIMFMEVEHCSHLNTYITFIFSKFGGVVSGE
jgi:hypothetical protein